MEIKWRAGAGALLAGLCAGGAQAADTLPDAEKRIGELEKQVSTLVQALQEVQQQLKQVKVESIANQVPEDVVRGNIREVGGLRDGLVFEDGGPWKLQLNGGIQGDYRHFTPDQQNTDTFSVRHARLSTTLFLFKDFSIKIEGEYATSNNGGKDSTALTNGYFDFSRWPQAKLRVGQFRPLFGLEHSTNDNFLGFQERSLMENLIQDIAYDRGMMVHGAPVKGAYYSVALTNGTGQNLDNQTSTANTKSDGFDTTARVRINAAEWMGSKDMVLHLGTSYNSGTIVMGASAAATYAVTEGRGLKFFKPAEFTGSNIDRNRWAIEGAWAYGPVKLQGEYMHVNYEGTSGANRYDRAMQAWYAQANWVVTGEGYPDTYSSGLFSRIRPQRNFDGEGGYGAVELGLRYSNFDASDFTRTNPAGTGVLTSAMSNGADAWTMSANWVLNPFVRVMANYIRTSFDTAVLVNGKSSDHEDALTMRAQLDF